MNNCLIENKEKVIQKEAVSVNWQESSSIQCLLDVISSIIAEEYIMVAKQNPKVFVEIASPATRPGGLAMTQKNE